MQELIITEIIKIDNVSIHQLTVNGKLKLTSLRLAIETARKSYLNTLCEPNIDNPSKKAFTNEVSILQEFLDKLKFLDHELPPISVQGSKKEPDFGHK